MHIGPARGCRLGRDARGCSQAKHQDREEATELHGPSDQYVARDGLRTGGFQSTPLGYHTMASRVISLSTLVSPTPWRVGGVLWRYGGGCRGCGKVWGLKEGVGVVASLGPAAAPCRIHPSEAAPPPASSPRCRGDWRWNRGTPCIHMLEVCAVGHDTRVLCLVHE